MKLPSSMKFYARFLLIRLLAITERKTVKKTIKAAIGSGRLYQTMIRLYIKFQYQTQPTVLSINESFVRTAPPLLTSPQKSIYVDITSLTHRDAGGGIQRTQKKFLQFGLTMKDVRLRPIASEGKNFYKVLVDEIDSEHKLRFTLSNELVFLNEDDIFLSLDLNYLSLISNFDFYLDLSSQGTDLWFLIYDLLPIEYPNFFPDGIADLHESWLNNLLKVANVLCISRTVQEKLDNYIHVQKISRANFLNLQVYLGSDPCNNRSVPTLKRMPNDPPKFIAVGTLEPRKGYDEILDACQALWGQGKIFELHFIGALGWKSNRLKNRIVLERARNPFFFWHDSATDEELAYHYATCDALIAASFDEGYGLPIAEALRRKKVVFARKIDVFKEVIGNSELFFESKFDLELQLLEYIHNPRLDKFRENNDYSSRSWQEFTREMVNKIIIHSSNHSRRSR